MKRSNLVCLSLLTALLAFANPALAQLTTNFESFNTAGSTAADGWAGVGNTSNGQSYDFSNTGNTIASPGEAGGHFIEATNMSYYGVSLGGLYTLANQLHGEGYLTIKGSQPSPAILNDYIAIGFFNSTNAGGPQRNLLGVTVQEYGATTHSTDWRGRTGISFSNGGRLDASIGGVDTRHVWYMPSNYLGAYYFTFDYNPAGGPSGLGQLTATLTNVTTGSILGGTLTANLSATSAANRAAGAFFDSFGLATGGQSAGDPNSYFDLYIDNVYAVVPEPSSLVLAGLGLVALLRLRRVRF